MNKYKKSLNQLIVHIPEETLIMWAQDFEYYIDNMQELVDRATPMKPKEEKLEISNEKIFVCPNCRAIAFMEYEFDKENYCGNCGQALDWSEEE